MKQRSSIPCGQEHWPRLRIGTCGQRLRLLNTQVLPQDYIPPEESLRKGGNAREKHIACTLCLQRFLSVDKTIALTGAISRVVISTLATAAAMSGRLASGTENTSRPTCTNRRIGQVFQQWRAVILGYISLVQTRIDQEARDQTWLLHWPNTPTAPGDIAGRDANSCPGTVISYRDAREMRRTVGGRAKQKQTAWSACQTHNRVPLLENRWPA